LLARTRINLKAHTEKQKTKNIKTQITKKRINITQFHDWTFQSDVLTNIPQLKDLKNFFLQK